MDDTPSTGQKIGAEALGTFVLVFFGCGSVAIASQEDAITTATTVGLTFGLAVVVMTYAVGRISGGHFNPAVSVGAGVAGRISWRDVGLYVLAQLVGAILAGAVLFALLHGFDGFDAKGAMGQNFFGDQNPHREFAAWAAFLLEMLLTALFLVTILAVTDSRNEHPALAPLAIGLAYAAIHFVAVPATGTSVNPARSIGPALFAGSDAIIQLWLFILAPLLGALAAGLAYPLLFGHGSEPVAGSGLRLGRGATSPGYGATDQYQQQWNQQDPQAQQAWTLEQAAAQGWHWDVQAQQWRHVSEGWPQEPQQQWPDPSQDDGRTQVRQPPAE